MDRIIHTASLTTETKAVNSEGEKKEFFCCLGVDV